MPDAIVVGAGHNRLIAACYLAMEGRSVLVLEAQTRPGGGSRTEERPGLPGYRFDLHSAAHNIINMTAIPDELDLAGAGLVYQQMDPFSGPPGMNVGVDQGSGVRVRSCGRTWSMGPSVSITRASAALAEWNP